MWRSLAQSSGLQQVFSAFRRNLTTQADIPLPTQSWRSMVPPQLLYPEDTGRLFAVVHVGGHQYKVTTGDKVLVDKLEVEVGADIVLQKVMIVGGLSYSIFGRPLITTAAVYANVEEQVKTEKHIIFKFRRRHNYRRKTGHRQPMTVLRITGINPGEVPTEAEFAQLPEAKQAMKVAMEEELRAAKELAAKPVLSDA